MSRVSCSGSGSAMSDPGPFRVDSAAPQSHAADVDTIGDGLAFAAAAGQTMLNGLQQNMVDAMNTAAASAHHTADTLRSVATAHETADATAADRIHNTR